ncbi:MAG TPA: sensor domain-containing diguanylate cyclase [Acidimicrobiales bacterium]|nr:sensor domain-containing diguanylate cyclase [Acidimicrobiales bacterium]
MYSRSAIDGGILKAAGTGADPAVVAAEADVLLRQVDDELDAARGLFVDGGADEVLLASFDTMARAMNVYVDDAIALAGLLIADPASVPAHLVRMGAAAQELEQRQLDFGAQVTAATTAARADATTSVDSSQMRILSATSAAVLVLLLVAVGMDRRIRRTSAAKSAADAMNRETSARLGEQVERREFAEDLREALDVALDERMTLDVVTRAMHRLELGGVAEVLLADSSSAHVSRVASTNDQPGCGVESPNDCPAVRRGQALTFASSEELRACPHLRGRPGGPLSAMCVPLLFDGRGIGVLHATGPDGDQPVSLAAAGLRVIANDAAMSIGTQRVLATTQVQAKTDGLTGTFNRRTLEGRLSELVNSGTSMTLAMVDLDHFKDLNETYGHEGGDRALRVFSTVVHHTLRSGDVAGRYGGEEFVLAFPGLDLPGALVIIERVREALRLATESGACPPFTASFGLSEWQSDMTVDSLLRIADVRLREAKRLGRNRVVSSDTLVVDKLSN